MAFNAAVNSVYDSPSDDNTIIIETGNLVAYTDLVTIIFDDTGGTVTDNAYNPNPLADFGPAAVTNNIQSPQIIVPALLSVPAGQSVVYSGRNFVN